MTGLTTANSRPIFQKNPKLDVLLMSDADTDLVTLLSTAGDEGSLIDSIAVVSTDTVDILLQLFITDTAINYKIGEVLIPAGSGNDGTLPSIDLLNEIKMPFLQAGGGLPLETGQTLGVACSVTMTAATVLSLVAIGGDY